jgi:hypothetical protein
MATQTIGTVNVRVNTTPSVQVRSIQYLPNRQDYTVKAASDVEILNTANNNSVMTYDETTQKFVVQNIVRLNGGIF